MVILVRNDRLDKARLEFLGLVEELIPLALDNGSVLLDLVDISDKVHAKGG